MEKRSVLGNQQERREADLNWLGGLFDGEGSVSILATCKNRFTHMVVQVRLVSSDEPTMNEVCRILGDHHIPHHVANHKPSKLASKPTKHLVISGMKRSYIALCHLLPYVRTKRAHAEVALDFIKSRMERGKKAQYSEQEIDLFMKLRELHGYRLRESSETTRTTLLQRRYSPPSARKTESAAEMTAP